MKSVRIKVSVTEFEWMRNTIRSIVGCGSISDDVYASWRWEMLLGLHLRMSRVSVVGKKSVAFRLNIPECVVMNGLLGIGGHPYGWLWSTALKSSCANRLRIMLPKLMN